MRSEQYNQKRKLRNVHISGYFLTLPRTKCNKLTLRQVLSVCLSVRTPECFTIHSE